MTRPGKREALEQQTAPYELPSFAAGMVDHLVDQIDRFALEIEHNPIAPNARVFAREIRVNCRQAREQIREWRQRAATWHE